MDSKLVLTASISILILSCTMLLPTIFADQVISYISKIGSTGSGDGELKYPSDVAVDSSGNIYVVDTSNNRVQIFDSKGNYISKIGSTGYGDGEFKDPTGVAVDSSGNIYVVDTDNNRVEEFSALKNNITIHSSPQTSVNNGTLEVMNFTKSQSVIIPVWIKNNAKWWSEGQLGDDDFVKGIQYLIQENIMKIPYGKSGANSSHEIPLWVKNNAGWWASGQISDDDFVKGMQYLITNGIIKIT